MLCGVPVVVFWITIREVTGIQVYHNNMDRKDDFSQHVMKAFQVLHEGRGTQFHCLSLIILLKGFFHETSPF